MGTTESGKITIEYDVLVPRKEYEKFLRESEQLAIIKRYIEEREFPSAEDIRLILGVERKEKEV